MEELIKKCYKCGIEKKESEFSISQWKRNSSKCKVCLSEYNLKYNQEHKEERKIKDKQYRKEHKEERKVKRKIYDEENEGKIKKYQKQYREEHKEEQKARDKKHWEENKEQEKLRNKKYREEHKEEKKEYDRKYLEEHREERREYKKEYHKKRIIQDPFYKFMSNISKSVGNFLVNNFGSKNGMSFWDHVDYTKEEFKAHIIAGFSRLENLTADGQIWMTLDNYGKYIVKGPNAWKDDDISTHRWNFDHKIPLADLKHDSFDHPNFKKAWSLENLRPYSAKQNVIDGAAKVRHKKKIDNG